MWLIKHMTKTDLDKLLKAGYTFIRTDKHSLCIKTQSQGQYSHGWRTMEKGFKTIKEMDKRLQELLKDEKTLEM